MDGGRVMGKLYKGCYIKVEDTDELGNALVTRTYITGPRGGCYYINDNGNKVYVDHSFCH